MKRKLIFFLISAIACLLLVFLMFFVYFKYQIQKIIIISTYSKIYGLEVLKGQNLLFIDTDKIDRTLLTRNPFIKSITITKHYPETLIMDVKIRNPRYLIVKDSIVFPVDEEGTVLSNMPYDEFLPKIEVTNFSIISYGKTDWRILKAINLLVNIEKQSILVDRILIDDGGGLFLIDLPAGSKIVVPYNADAPFIGTSLQLIMSRFRIEGKFVSKIDFRFDKPVVILSNGEKISSILVNNV
jgi:hypothetical protein